MKILILGGDGYLGWPTAMNLSAAGHDVVVVDNYLRRNITQEESVEPLYALPNLIERCKIWKASSGHDVVPYIGDLQGWAFVETVFKSFTPDAIVHYAEQPSAPYSTKDHNTARLTLTNNLLTTFNVLQAMHMFCPNAHLVKLGTMGEYGTPNIDIEEGWLNVTHNDRTDKFLFPRQAGSLYHTTKIQDTDMIWLHVRMWGLRVTDLMQGLVYGEYTDENQGDDRLLPHFAYDEMFGTVLNRFIVQAIAGYPLTIYGKGGQTRGFLNIKDTLQCIKLSIENPADQGELRIFNQFTETFSVNELAALIQSAAKVVDVDVEVQTMENPRKELEEHYYNPAHTDLVEMGLKPNFLTEDVLVELLQLTLRHKDNIVQDRIFRNVKWA